jgi:sulfhydrogenase subunit delta
MAQAMTKARPKVAFFDFTSCEGCQLTVLDTLQNDLGLLNAVEIVNFREAISERGQDYQIAFIEGSCSRPADEDRLRRIREQADVVVALGACAHLGGINAIKNRQPLPFVRQFVYGDKAEWYDTYAVRPIDEVIEVDAVVPGCPIDGDEFSQIVKMLLRGRIPRCRSAWTARCWKTPVCSPRVVCAWARSRAVGAGRAAPATAPAVRAATGC